MSRSLECAQVMDWLLEAVPVWERPVSAAMLAEAVPHINKRTVIHALRNLVEAGVLYMSDDRRGACMYLPEGKRPVPDIQVLICKGHL